VEQLLLRQRRVVRRRGLPGQAGRPVQHTERGHQGGRDSRRRIRVRRRGRRRHVVAVLLLSIDHRVPHVRMAAHSIRFVFFPYSYGTVLDKLHILFWPNTL